MLAMFGIWRGDDNDSRLLSRLQWDIGRWLAGVWAIYLDATPGGLTHSRLSALLETGGVSAGPRARSLIIYLQFVGFIEPAPPGPDRRSKVYRATERLKAAFRVRYQREFDAMSVLDPVHDGLAPRLNDPGFFDGLIAAVGDLTTEGFRIRKADTGPSLDVIAQRYGGVTMLGHLFSAGSPTVDAYPPNGPVRFSTKDVARCCGVSRTQLKRTLEVGANAGFFRWYGEGEVEFAPQLIDHAEMFAAGTFLIVQWAVAQALKTADVEAVQRTKL